MTATDENLPDDSSASTDSISSEPKPSIRPKISPSPKKEENPAPIPSFEDLANNKVSEKASQASAVDPSITFDEDDENTFSIGGLIIDAVAAAAAITFTALIVKDALPFLN